MDIIQIKAKVHGPVVRILPGVVDIYVPVPGCDGDYGEPTGTGTCIAIDLSVEM